MIEKVPRHLEKRITRLGGRAANGWPLFRVMRGCDRFQIMAGEKVLKYPNAIDRYIFEMLLFCEMTPKEWEEKFTILVDGKTVRLNGPYPENGEYEIMEPYGIIEKVTVHPRTKMVLKREFAPLTSTLCDALVETAVLNQGLTSKHRQEATRERRTKEEAAKEQLLIDKIDEMGLAFGGKTFVTVPSSSEISKYS
jgi:hypothetical protein